GTPRPLDPRACDPSARAGGRSTTRGRRRELGRANTPSAARRGRSRSGAPRVVLDAVERAAGESLRELRELAVPNLAIVRHAERRGPWILARAIPVREQEVAPRPGGGGGSWVERTLHPRRGGVAHAPAHPAWCSTPWSAPLGSRSANFASSQCRTLR